METAIHTCPRCSQETGYTVGAKHVKCENCGHNEIILNNQILVGDAERSGPPAIVDGHLSAPIADVPAAHDDDEDSASSTEEGLAPQEKGSAAWKGAAIKSASCSIRLTLTTLTGQTATVVVSSDATVQSIKDMAQKACVAGSMHTLAHGNIHLLETKRTVMEVGLADGDTLYILPVLPGGMSTVTTAAAAQLSASNGDSAT